MKNVIIIGAGPAGISASLYTIRAGFETTVISKTGGSLYKAHKIDNYYGFSGISGEELYEKGKEDAKKLGVSFIDEEVVGIGFSDKFMVKTTKNEYSADAVIIATGTKREKPLIKNLESFEGKGVSYCAVCDAFFQRGKDVAVLGNKSYALSEANELINIANSVTILTNGEECEIKGDYNINPKKIKELYGNESLEKVIFEDESEISVSGFFVAIGTAGGMDLAKKMGIALDENKIITDENGMTNIPGIFSAGDCVSGEMQIAKAVYDGMKAGLGAINFLRKK